MCSDRLAIVHLPVGHGAGRRGSRRPAAPLHSPGAIRRLVFPTLNPQPRVAPKRFGEGGSTLNLSSFTLIELMVVIGIIVVMTLLLVPAFTSMKGSNDVTSGAYAIKGVLEQARTYAMANNTYTWVGFYEEDGSKSSTTPATAGTGRIVLSAVGSNDGTTIYTTPASPATTIDPTKLSQLVKLVKIDNAHLKTFPNGTCTGSTFDTRPAPSTGNSQIGDTEPPSASLTPIQYPVGNPAPVAQYTFTKALQFSPRGEARIDNNNYSLKTVIEIGIQPAHSSAPNTNSANLVAIQLAGVSGDIKIYRK